MRFTGLVGIAIAGSLIALSGAAPAKAATHARPAAYIEPGGTITVSAASSLTDVLPVIAAAFVKRFPQVTIKFNFGGSSTLVEQLNAGAPVDVIATASDSTMAKALAAGTAVAPLLFAKNTMAIAMPSGNAAKVNALTDLARPGVLVAVCDVAVPCGAAARDLSRTPISR